MMIIKKKKNIEGNVSQRHNNNLKLVSIILLDTIFPEYNNIS